MTWLKSIGAVLALGTVWTVFMGVGMLEGWFTNRVAPADDVDAFSAVIEAHIQQSAFGNFALVLVEDGEIVWERYESTGDPVDRDTQFQVASLSKWLTAYGVMKLVEDDKVDLDAPIERYLTRWKLPDSEFAHNKVTPRLLLSHMSGLTDGLGFAGYEPGSQLPTLEEALANPHASNNREARIAIGAEPGSQWQYSGGGYLILQLLIEEVSGQGFEEFMQAEILGPIGMTRSTFVYPENPANIAASYETDGTIGTLYRFTASGAAGLYTSVADMAEFLRSNMGLRESPLSPETIRQMREPHGSTMGADIWGLGVMLMVPTDNDDFIVGHGGSNDPAINTMALFNPDTNDGLVVFESGSTSLASEIGSMWNIWQTGKPDLIAIVSGAELERIALTYIAGWIVIMVFVVVMARRNRRKRSL